jgi:hypothetical protein
MKTKEEIWDKHKATHLTYSESALAAMEEYAEQFKPKTNYCTCGSDFTMDVAICSVCYKDKVK